MKTESIEKYGDLLAAAAGSPGRALALLERKELNVVSQRRECALAVLDAVHSRMRFSELYEALSALRNKRQSLIEDLTELTVATRDLILLKRDELAPLCFFSDREQAQMRSERLSLRALFAIYDATGEAILQLQQNANVGVVSASLADALYTAPSKR